MHEHTDECYSETEESAGEENATPSDAGNREPSLCTHVCSEESGCITKVLDCHHEHDADAAGTVDVKISAVAMTEKDGTVIGYYGESNFADAFGESNHDVTITLLDNVTTSTRITVNTDNLTLDLNGKTYTHINNTAFNVPLNYSLTIKGSGEVTTSGFYCLTVIGGTLNIESGSFSAVDSAVAINGGDLQLTGGSFTGETNAIVFYSGEVTEALKNYGGAEAPHYAFYQGSSPYAPSGSSLSKGTFTVGECQHTGVEVTNLGDGKHGLICPYCGYHYEHTTTLTATASGIIITKAAHRHGGGSHDLHL